MFESSEKLNNQAIVLAQKGEYDEAIACFKRALTMENQNYLLWFNLGLTYRESGDLENARSALEQAHGINPYDSQVIETLAVLTYSTGSLDDAMEYCAEGLKLNKSNANLWNTVGVIYYNQSDFADAAEAFENAVSINPYYSDALYNLRDTYQELDNKTGAEECEFRLKELH